LTESIDIFPLKSEVFVATEFSESFSDQHPW